jgi:hypothetical protein
MSVKRRRRLLLFNQNIIDGSTNIRNAEMSFKDTKYFYTLIGNHMQYIVRTWSKKVEG